MVKKYYDVVIFRSVTKSAWDKMPESIKQKVIQTFITNRKSNMLTYYSTDDVDDGHVVRVSIKDNDNMIGYVYSEHQSSLDDTIHYRPINEVLG